MNPQKHLDEIMGWEVSRVDRKILDRERRALPYIVGRGQPRVYKLTPRNQPDRRIPEDATRALVYQPWEEGSQFIIYAFDGSASRLSQFIDEDWEDPITFIRE